MTRFFFPQYTFLTPPVRPLFSWVGRWAALLVVAMPLLFGAMIQSRILILPLMVVIVLLGGAVAVQVVALQTCKPWVPQPPRVEERKETLTKAGNPQVLFDALRFRDLDAIRGGDANNRLTAHSNDTGGARASIQFEGVIALESQPMALPMSSSLPQAAAVLEYAGIAFGLLGWALALLVPMTAPEMLPLKLAGAIPIGIGWTFFHMAYCLRNTFHFRSDLFGICFRGTMQRQTAGGEGAGYGTVERWKREIHVSVLATRVLTECTVPELWDQPLPKERVHEVALKDARGALQAPRHILDTQLDQQFQENLAYVLKKLVDYRDTEGAVMGADEESEGAGQMIQAKARARTATSVPETPVAAPGANPP